MTVSDACVRYIIMNTATPTRSARKPTDPKFLCEMTAEELDAEIVSLEAYASTAQDGNGYPLCRWARENVVYAKSLRAAL